MTNFEPGIPTATDTHSIPVSRILGLNPGPMTGPGTNSYLIGHKRLALLDPGPADPLQLDNFLAAIGDRRLEWILVTHTHNDHSPGALALQRATGAALVGLPAPEIQGHDKTFQPERRWQDNDRLDCGEYRFRLIHTPGHVSNHLCYLLEEEKWLFSGDHILQGTTSVILPPDGSMSAYLDSLRRLQNEELLAIAPGHGDVMFEPKQELENLIRHRLRRESLVSEHLRALGVADLDTLVIPVYQDIDQRLIPLAKKTLLAHLIKLQEDGRVSRAGEQWSVTQ